jgi:hypothetical protein
MKQGVKKGHDFYSGKGVKKGMKQGMNLQWIGGEKGDETGYEFTVDRDQTGAEKRA